MIKKNNTFGVLFLFMILALFKIIIQSFYFFHFVVPYCTNLFSATLIIAIVARQRTKIQIKLSYKQQLVPSTVERVSGVGKGGGAKGLQPPPQEKNSLEGGTGILFSPSGKLVLGMFSPPQKVSPPLRKFLATPLERVI